MVPLEHLHPSQFPSNQHLVRLFKLQTLSKNSRTMGPASWSELVGVGLFANLGPQERARQEVLFEIVFSEER